MSPTLTTFLFELTNFLLLAGLLGWLLFKPVRAVLQARQAAEKHQADELATRTADAERLRADLEQRQRAFEQEMAKLRKEHLATADQEATAILVHARESAERERESTTRMLAHLERAQVERLSTAVAAATRESVARLLTTLNAPGLDAGLVQAACRQLLTLEGRALGAVLIEIAYGACILRSCRSVTSLRLLSLNSTEPRSPSLSALWQEPGAAGARRVASSRREGGVFFPAPPRRTDGEKRHGEPCAR